MVYSIYVNCKEISYNQRHKQKSEKRQFHIGVETTKNFSIFSINHYDFLVLNFSLWCISIALTSIIRPTSINPNTKVSQEILFFIITNIILILENIYHGQNKEPQRYILIMKKFYQRSVTYRHSNSYTGWSMNGLVHITNVSHCFLETISSS